MRDLGLRAKGTEGKTEKEQNIEVAQVFLQKQFKVNSRQMDYSTMSRRRL